MGTPDLRLGWGETRLQWAGPQHPDLQQTAHAVLYFLYARAEYKDRGGAGGSGEAAAAAALLTRGCYAEPVNSPMLTVL